MIAIYGGDRNWGLAVERVLRAAGVATRVASRPAELAKCLSDGRVHVVVMGPDMADMAGAAQAITAPVVLNAKTRASPDAVGRAARAFPYAQGRASPRGGTRPTRPHPSNLMFIYPTQRPHVATRPYALSA